jgi:hypothetical protein
MAVRNPKPTFRPYETWGACSRCNARVRYSSLRRERLTGLLVCSASSGRPVRPCWDPWPNVYDFQAFSDKSIDPPPEPLPLRYNLDAVWGNGPATGTTRTFANAGQNAGDDATRLQNLVKAVPYYSVIGRTAAFTPTERFSDDVANLTTILAADYDGTFLPSSSIRTVTPPDEAAELANVTKTDFDTVDSIWSPPWSAARKV